MDFELIYATEAYRDVINNLMQFYIYDFSEYLDYDVTENGLYQPYPSLDDYWSEPSGKFPYVIRKGGRYIGFIFVQGKAPEMDLFSIAEFFIMKKYRRTGIGNAAARKIFAIYKGEWLIHQREENVAAKKFWLKTIEEYTDGLFSQWYEDGRYKQSFNNTHL